MGVPTSSHVETGQLINRLHVFFAELEIENLEVLGNPRIAFRFGKYNEVMLECPSQTDLGY